jgi:hypothetical protein
VVPPISDRISRVPPYSRTMVCIACTGLSPAEARLSRRFHFTHHCHWPGPRSLATTSGVSLDILSCGYLDVSVPRVRFLSLFYSKTRYPYDDHCKSDTGDLLRYRNYSGQGWVSPFGNLRIKAYSQLPEAYRSVSRPSSPVHAKASTKCPYDT